MKIKLPMKSAALIAVLAVGVAAAACAPEEDPAGTASTQGPNGNGPGENGDGNKEPGPSSELPSEAQPISKVACLRKVALDLTNAGPSAADLDAVRAGTKSISDVADAYLASPKFSAIVFDWFRGKFAPTEKIPEDADKEEPARIARYLVANDVDFRELVTGTFTVDKNGAKASVGADAAGVLSTQSYLSAYSGIENRNWSGHLLTGMTGILLTPVSDVPDGIDASREGLASNPACSGCHVHPVYGVDFAARFHDCFDSKGLAIEGCTQKPVSFLGQQGQSLPDLGKILAGSVEWRATMIQTFYNRLGGRPIAKNELAQYRESEAAWMAAGYKPKALIKQIVTSEKYCSR